ncbi:hypothetical protein DID78_06485 [Candidatus Marinamargulisbacteria bacterium SCGC AG-343-D04]|nr:hypothetical protein DID78_06485 [Candidatus Marinamargulisbacteria bacterium SCGC AG-343-D04]
MSQFNTVGKGPVVHKAVVQKKEQKKEQISKGKRLFKTPAEVVEGLTEDPLKFLVRDPLARTVSAAGYIANAAVDLMASAAKAPAVVKGVVSAALLAQEVGAMPVQDEVILPEEALKGEARDIPTTPTTPTIPAPKGQIVSALNVARELLTPSFEELENDDAPQGASGQIDLERERRGDGFGPMQAWAKECSANHEHVNPVASPVFEAVAGERYEDCLGLGSGIEDAESVLNRILSSLDFPTLGRIGLEDVYQNVGFSEIPNDDRNLFLYRVGDGDGSGDGLSSIELPMAELKGNKLFGCFVGEGKVEELVKGLNMMRNASYGTCVEIMGDLTACIQCPEAAGVESGGDGSDEVGPWGAVGITLGVVAVVGTVGYAIGQYISRSRKADALQEASAIKSFDKAAANMVKILAEKKINELDRYFREKQAGPVGEVYEVLKKDLLNVKGMKELFDFGDQPMVSLGSESAEKLAIINTFCDIYKPLLTDQFSDFEFKIKEPLGRIVDQLYQKRAVACHKEIAQTIAHGVSADTVQETCGPLTRFENKWFSNQIEAKLGQRKLGQSAAGKGKPKVNQVSPESPQRLTSDELSKLKIEAITQLRYVLIFEDGDYKSISQPFVEKPREFKARKEAKRFASLSKAVGQSFEALNYARDAKGPAVTLQGAFNRLSGSEIVQEIKKNVVDNIKSQFDYEKDLKPYCTPQQSLGAEAEDIDLMEQLLALTDEKFKVIMAYLEADEVQRAYLAVASSGSANLLEKLESIHESGQTIQGITEIVSAAESGSLDRSAVESRGSSAASTSPSSSESSRDSRPGSKGVVDASGAKKRPGTMFENTGMSSTVVSLGKKAGNSGPSIRAPRNGGRLPLPQVGDIHTLGTRPPFPQVGVRRKLESEQGMIPAPPKKTGPTAPSAAMHDQPTSPNIDPFAGTDLFNLVPPEKKEVAKEAIREALAANSKLTLGEAKKVLSAGGLIKVLEAAHILKASLLGSSEAAASSQDVPVLPAGAKPTEILDALTKKIAELKDLNSDGAAESGVVKADRPDLGNFKGQEITAANCADFLAKIDVKASDGFEVSEAVLTLANECREACETEV